MKKDTALFLILNFGRQEERSLLAEGKEHEAYQIEHARRTMHYALLESIKHLREVLKLMTEYTVDERGFWQYSPYFFVMDEYTRKLIVDFIIKFDNR